MSIRILDAATVGRIAAGEVVERPASVLKELVENSLDAGATSITIEIEGGGIDLLRVTDNGCGIEPGQVRLAFENHATSKLRTPEDLDDIRTLGFRGEALPSIAAVSHVEMTTRARGQDTGVRVNVDGGKDLRVREIGCPEGTTFIMRDLFYNIPVRRAFLKKPAYEASLVSDVMTRMILGNPGVSMRFISGGRTVCHSFGDGKLRHAVFAVYGKETAEKMIEVDAASGGTRIRGLIGIGDLAKPSRAHEMFFINGRSVRCAMLSKALEEVSRTRVTIGMYPMCALDLTLPPHAIDVNVHPNKLEVRFRDEAVTRTVVEELLSSAFRGERVLDLARDTRPPAPVERVSEVVRVSDVDRMPPLPGAAPAPKPAKPEQVRLFPDAPRVPRGPVMPEEGARLREGPPAAGGSIRTVDLPADKAPAGVRAAQEPPEGPTPLPSSGATAPEGPKPVPPLLPQEETPYRVIGVAFRTYILLEVADSMLIIDQHAAHERLRYQEYCRQLESGTASQQLLTPLVLRLSPREMALIRDNVPLLEEAGYAVEAFGEQDIRVTAVPHILGRAELRPVFLEMIDSLYRLRAATLDVRRAEIMQMSCKSAVKGGDALSRSEIDALVREMLETGASPTCPHGRPVVRNVPRRELEKLFKRIQ